MTQLDKMIAWENGELDDADVIALFQDLIDSGMAWTLQGCYGRQAQALIDAGLCSMTRPDRPCDPECARRFSPMAECDCSRSRA